MRIRARALAALLLVAAVLGAAGCAGSGADDEAAPGAQPAASFEGAETKPVVGPMERAETALLQRVALARHDGYDRVVFEFTNHRPGYRVEYVEPPLHEDGSGAPVEVAGSAFVIVRMETASGFDFAKPEGELVYKGPRRIAASDAGTSIVREAVRTGDFEAVLSWAVGLDALADFRVLTLEAPPRLAVDFRH